MRADVVFARHHYLDFQEQKYVGRLMVGCQVGVFLILQFGLIAVNGSAQLVGLLTVAVILAETNGFALISHARQLVSYAGYDVVENQSRKRSGATRISKKGNHRIRCILHFPTINVVKFQGGIFADLFERTYRRHHIKMKSYVAVQKKLLIILYTLWRKDQSSVDQSVAVGKEEG